LTDASACKFRNAVIAVIVYSIGLIIGRLSVV